jgi:hypothetical protein
MKKAKKADLHAADFGRRLQAAGLIPVLDPSWLRPQRRKGNEKAEALQATLHQRRMHNVGMGTN